MAALTGKENHFWIEKQRVKKLLATKGELLPHQQMKELGKWLKEETSFVKKCIGMTDSSLLDTLQPLEMQWYKERLSRLSKISEELHMDIEEEHFKLFFDLETTADTMRPKSAENTVFPRELVVQRSCLMAVLQKVFQFLIPCQSDRRDLGFDARYLMKSLLTLLGHCPWVEITAQNKKGNGLSNGKDVSLIVDKILTQLHGALCERFLEHVDLDVFKKVVVTITATEISGYLLDEYLNKLKAVQEDQRRLSASSPKATKPMQMSAEAPVNPTNAASDHSTSTNAEDGGEEDVFSAALYENPTQIGDTLSMMAATATAEATEKPLSCAPVAIAAAQAEAAVEDDILGYFLDEYLNKLKAVQEDQRRLTASSPKATKPMQMSAEAPVNPTNAASDHSTSTNAEEGREEDVFPAALYENPTQIGNTLSMTIATATPEATEKPLSCASVPTPAAQAEAAVEDDISGYFLDEYLNKLKVVQEDQRRLSASSPKATKPMQMSAEAPVNPTNAASDHSTSTNAEDGGEEDVFSAALYENPTQIGDTLSMMAATATAEATEKPLSCAPVAIAAAQAEAAVEDDILGYFLDEYLNKLKAVHEDQRRLTASSPKATKPMQMSAEAPVNPTNAASDHSTSTNAEDGGEEDVFSAALCENPTQTGDTLSMTMATATPEATEKPLSCASVPTPAAQAEAAVEDDISGYFLDEYLNKLKVVQEDQTRLSASSPKAAKPMQMSAEAPVNPTNAASDHSTSTNAEDGGEEDVFSAALYENPTQTGDTLSMTMATATPEATEKPLSCAPVPTPAAQAEAAVEDDMSSKLTAQDLEIAAKIDVETEDETAAQLPTSASLGTLLMTADSNEDSIGLTGKFDTLASQVATEPSTADFQEASARPVSPACVHATPNEKSLSSKLSGLNIEVATKQPLTIDIKEEEKWCETATDITDAHAVKAEQDQIGPHPPFTAPVDDLDATPASNQANLGDAIETSITEESRAPGAVATLDGTKPKKKKGKVYRFFRRLRKAVTGWFKT